MDNETDSNPAPPPTNGNNSTKRIENRAEQGPGGRLFVSTRDEWSLGQRMDYGRDPWPVGMSSKLFNWFQRRHALLAKTPEERQSVVDEFVEVRTVQLFSAPFKLMPWLHCTNCPRDDLQRIASLFSPEEIGKALRGQFLKKEMPDWVADWFPELEKDPESIEAADWIGGWYLAWAVYHPDPEDRDGAMARMLGYWLTMHSYWMHPAGFYDFSKFAETSFAKKRIAGDEPCPSELARFIRRWQLMADKKFKKWHPPGCFVKNAGIRFRYKGRNYNLGTFGFGDGSDEFFESISRDMTFALADFGAEEVRYTGMLD